MLCLMVYGVGCAPVNVINAEGENGFALKNYKTFDFAVEDSLLANASQEYKLQTEYARAEIKSQLENRGLSLQSNSPDLIVNLGIVIQDKTQTRETNFTTDPPRYTGQRRYTWQSKEVEVGTYKAGTLSLHLVDPTKNQLVWKGEAETVIPKKEENSQERISKTIQALLRRIH
ncbi:hypothetical protein TH61_14885 [Rufibacter sp. DG15C]|nr:hypothetical protein TH61_14885 [Rufibacter sp. DG15C]